MILSPWLDSHPFYSLSIKSSLLRRPVVLTRPVHLRGSPSVFSHEDLIPSWYTLPPLLSHPFTSLSSVVPHTPRPPFSVCESRYPFRNVITFVEPTSVLVPPFPNQPLCFPLPKHQFPSLFLPTPLLGSEIIFSTQSQFTPGKYLNPVDTWVSHQIWVETTT